MSSAYYDTNYLFKLQCWERGSLEVRAHAATVNVLCTAAHGRAEFASAAFRKVREGAASAYDYQLALAQLRLDASSGHLRFLPLTDSILERVEAVYLRAEVSTFLRAADALHLATAAEYGFGEIHSNDKHLLAAAPLFFLKGVNVIP